MFFCEECRVKKGWPQSYGGSYGRCEICHKEDSCYDVPSKHLPLPKPEKVKDVHTAHCCQKHGCKYSYGYKDQDCTVVKYGGQESMCSYCWEELYDEGGWEDAHLLNELFEKGRYYALKRMQKLVLDTRKKMNEKL